ncbi:MAG: redoxin domain-containing protein, partial [Bacteroidota bacterium]
AFPVVLALLSSGCSKTGEAVSAADTTFTVNLSVKGLDSGMFLMFYRSGEERKSDTIRLVSGAGTISGQVQSPVRAYLQRIQPPGYDMLPFYLENGSISITGVMDSIYKATVTGTISNELNKELQGMLAPVRKAEEEFGAKMSAAAPDQQLPQDSVFAMYEQLNKARQKITIDFVSLHPSSVVSANEVLEMFMYNPDPKKFDSAFHLLDSSVVQTSTGKELIKRLEIAKRTDLGQPAPLFTMDDQQGRPIELSRQLGKYLLIDFWASWCGPCREDNPNLVKAYQEYGKKGFGIVSVSLDSEKDRDKWLEAIRKDKLTWVQVSDLKGWENAAARTYGINGIPMNFLLDPDGRIIAKGLRGSDLRRKLAGLIR